MPQSQRSNSFVVRIWREGAEADDQSGGWRGWVQHTRSGEAIYVQDVSGMLAFMEQWTGDMAAECDSEMRLR